MFPMLSQSTSEAFDEAIKAGDAAAFRATFAAGGVDASALLYSRARKGAWPLLKRVLADPFPAETLEGRLEMASFLLDQGADTHVSAPWGTLLVGGLVGRLHIDTKATERFEVTRFTADMLLERDVVLDARSKGLGDTDLDMIFWGASWEFSRGDAQLVGPAMRNLIDVMIERGAPMTQRERYLDHAELSGQAERATHVREPMSLFARATPLPAGTLSDEGEQAWRDGTHGRHGALRSVALIRDRAFRHHGWGWSEPEDAAVSILRDVKDALADKAAKRELGKAITKLSKPNKPVFDEDLYARAAQIVTEAETTRDVAGLPSA